MTAAVKPFPQNAAPAVHIVKDDAEALAVADRLAAELRPGASDRDRERRIPREELKALAASGLLGIIIPKVDGGAGVSLATLAEVVARLAAADPAVAQVPQNHFAFLEVIRHSGTDTQRAFFFDEVLRTGARLGNALSERGTKHVMEFKTKLTPHADGGYRLNGTKYYCTGALTAQYVPVFALDELDRLVIAYIDRDWPGIEITDDWTAMGQRSTISGTTKLTDVAVPRDRIVPLYPKFGMPQTDGAFGQLIHAAVDVGIARNALSDGAVFVRDMARPWFESGLDKASDEQMTLHKFGELQVKVWAADALLAKAGAALDAAVADTNAETTAAASLAVAAAKAFAGDTALDVANEIFAYGGTRAADDRYNLHRHWRNARTHTLHDPNRWKYFHIGNATVNGKPPPSHGLI